MTGPFPIRHELTTEDNRLNAEAITARAAEIMKRPKSAWAEQIGSLTLTHTEPFTKQEAFQLALQYAQAERESNDRNELANKAYALQQMCAEGDAKRIAETLSEREIRFEIARRFAGSFADIPQRRDERAVYERALEMQQARHLQAAE